MVSPVHYSDCKYCASDLFFWTDVVFRSDQEIDEFVNSLLKLKTKGDSNKDPYNHVHLKDYGMDKHSSNNSSEIVFFGPNFFNDSNESEIEHRRIASQSANEFLKSYLHLCKEILDRIADAELSKLDWNEEEEEDLSCPQDLIDEFKEFFDDLNRNEEE